MPGPADFQAAVNLTPKQFTDEFLQNGNDNDFGVLSSLLVKKEQKTDPNDRSTRDVYVVKEDVTFGSLKKFYANTESLFICDNDKLSGIKTRKLMTSAEFTAVGLDINNFPTGVAYYRDATDQNLLNQRAEPDDSRYARNELMLRSLDIVRGIDHAFEQLANTADQNQKDFYNGLRRLLAAHYGSLVADYDKLSKTLSVEQIEAKFNSYLTYFLKEGCLDVGINPNREDPGYFKEFYAKLLVNYRFLAGTIEPAAAVVTVFKDPARNATFTETALPITEKTENQKAELGKMKTFPEERHAKDNYHTAQSPSIQLAQALFADRVSADDSILAPQLRQTIAPAIKNGYEVKFKIRLANGEEKTIEFVRMGSAAYLGKGESSASLVAHAKEILAQIIATVNPAAKVHQTVLNTPTSLDVDGEIVRVTKAAHVDNDTLTVVPLNRWGAITEPVAVSKLIDNIQDIIKTPTGRLSKEGRAFFAAMAALSTSEIENIISVFSCASGQDRTGVIHVLVTALAIVKAYKPREEVEAGNDSRANETLKIDDSLIQTAIGLVMQGSSAQFLATLASPGSSGLKPCSMPGNFFGEHADRLFLKGADKGKDAPVDETMVMNIAKQPRLLRLEFAANTAPSLQMSAPKFVAKALKSYLNKAKGFFSGLMANQELLTEKMRLAGEASRDIGSNVQALTLILLQTRLKDLKAAIDLKAVDVNHSSFFTHKPGRLDATIERCLKYVNEAIKIENIGQPPLRPAPH